MSEIHFSTNLICHFVVYVEERLLARQSAIFIVYKYPIIFCHLHSKLSPTKPTGLTQTSRTSPNIHCRQSAVSTGVDVAMTGRFVSVFTFPVWITVPRCLSQPRSSSLANRASRRGRRLQWRWRPVRLTAACNHLDFIWAFKAWLVIRHNKSGFVLNWKIQSVWQVEGRSSDASTSIILYLADEAPTSQPSRPDLYI